MSEGARAPRPRIDRDDVVRLVSIAWIALVTFGWWSVLAVQWDDDEAMRRRDYYCFFRAGELLASDGNPYAQIDHAFVNPPFSLPLVGALFALGLRGSYVALAALGTLFWGLGCWLASRLGDVEPRRRQTLVFAMLTAPSAFLSLHLGQLSGLYFAMLAGSLLLFARGRDRAAGAVAALLLAKPNLAVAIVGAALLSRRTRFLAAFALTGLALLVAALPFGTGVWVDFWEGLARLAHRHDVVHADYWKQFTVYAFFRSVTHPIDPSGVTARLAWIAVLVGFAVPIVRVLIRYRQRWSEPPIAARLASVVVLTTCALNTYLFFYDASFLALPAAMLAVAPWRSRSLRAVAIGAAALSWLLQVWVTFVHENPPLGGVVAAVWLAAELWDLSPGVGQPAPPGAAHRPPLDDHHAIAQPSA